VHALSSPIGNVLFIAGDIFDSMAVDLKLLLNLFAAGAFAAPFGLTAPMWEMGR
jgi:hypothetical protein